MGFEIPKAGGPSIYGQTGTGPVGRQTNAGETSYLSASAPVDSYTSNGIGNTQPANAPSSIFSGLNIEALRSTGVFQRTENAINQFTQFANSPEGRIALDDPSGSSRTIGMF